MPRYERNDSDGCVTHLYAIAIGSNRRHGRFGRPAGVVVGAIERLDRDFGLFDASPILLNPAHAYGTSGCARHG